MVTHDPHAAEYSQSIVHLDKGQLGSIEPMGKKAPATAR
jgi:ABC-type lipoprotein export system ATPase subunit